MKKYRVSLDVVRKANERTRTHQYYDDVSDAFSAGELVVHLNTCTLTKEYVLTRDQINEAYYKALEATSELLPAL